MGSRSPRGRFGSYLKSVKDRQEKFVPKAPRRGGGTTTADSSSAGITRPSSRDESAFLDRDTFNRIASGLPLPPSLRLALLATLLNLSRSKYELSPEDRTPASKASGSEASALL